MSDLTLKRFRMKKVKDTVPKFKSSLLNLSDNGSTK